jgi:hypothetical protein
MVDEEVRPVSSYDYLAVRRHFKIVCSQKRLALQVVLVE